MKELTFFASGSPAPGGSKRAFIARRRDGSFVCRKGTHIPMINMTDAGGRANEIWKRDVAIQAKAFMAGSQPLEGPLKVEFIFYLRRPQSHYRSGKFAAVLRSDAPMYHTQAPDAAKYGRSTEDALTGILWVDDAQNVRVCSEKRWCEPGKPSGCQVRVVIVETPAVVPVAPATLALFPES